MRINKSYTIKQNAVKCAVFYISIFFSLTAHLSKTFLSENFDQFQKKRTTFSNKKKFFKETC